MCGIAGFYVFGQSPDAGALNQIKGSLSHRGPDGRGIW